MPDRSLHGFRVVAGDHLEGDALGVEPARDLSAADAFRGPNGRFDRAAYAEGLAVAYRAAKAADPGAKVGFGPVAYRDVEVVRDENGCPHVHLHGRAAELAQARGLQHWAISLSHDAGLAAAFVVALTVRPAPESPADRCTA